MINNMELLYSPIETKVDLINNNKYLDIFINDPDEYIRAQVAKQHFGLDILIKDMSPYVRATVAKQGYGLSKLSTDPNKIVRIAVNSMI